VFYEAAEARLWEPTGSRALAYLRQRGLSEETIRTARLGYHAGDVWDKPDIWGLPPKQKKIWLPAGIVVPWLIGSDLWRISIRRIGDTIGTEQRYVVVSGSGNTLFGVDTLMRSAGFGSMADARTPTSTSVSCVVPTRRSSPVL